MDLISTIIDWLDRYEGVLQALVAVVMIAGFILSPLAAGFRRAVSRSFGAPAATPDIGVPEIRGFTESKIRPPVPDSAPASIAVIPFESRSQDPEFEYLADGITTETLSALSGVKELRVAPEIACHAYRGRNLDLRAVADDLGVRYILTGTARGDARKIKVTATLIDVDEAEQIWSTTFDRPRNDLFQVQEELAGAIVAAVSGEQIRHTLTLLNRIETPKLDAWGLAQKAYVLWATRYGVAALRDARDLARRAVEIDPDYAFGQATLATVLIDCVISGLSEDALSDLSEALTCANRAIDLRPDDTAVLRQAGNVRVAGGQYESAIPCLRRAVRMAPYDFIAWGQLGRALTSSPQQEDLEESRDILERIITTVPDHPDVPVWLTFLAVTYACMERYEDAARCARESVERMPSFFWGWMALGNALGVLGRIDDARAAIAKAAEANPAMTPEFYKQSAFMMSAGQPQKIEQVTKGLDAAEAA